MEKGVNSKSIAIIPARGGSKRIPRKNIKLFLGQPIIKYPIDAALGAGIFDTVMVSTEDEEIKTVAISCKAEVPFLRSKKTSDDSAGLGDVVGEVIGEYEKIGRRFGYICCILATAPFVSPERILGAFKMLKDSDADSVVPVVRFGYPIQRAFEIKGKMLRMIWPENYARMSNDLPPAYHDCGQFYWLRSERFMKKGKFFTDLTLPYEIPESEAQDIDSEEDWKIAEMKYAILKRPA